MTIFAIIAAAWISAVALALALCRIGQMNRSLASDKPHRPVLRLVPDPVVEVAPSTQARSLRLVRDDDALGEMECGDSLIAG